MPQFVLQKIPGSGFLQGPVNIDITIKVQSDNANTVMALAFLTPAGGSAPKALSIVNGNVVFQLSKGRQLLSVTIQKIDPHFADWQVVEVDPNGNAQTLGSVDVSSNPGDPFSLNIPLTGV